MIFNKTSKNLTNLIRIYLIPVLRDLKQKYLFLKARKLCLSTQSNNLQPSLSTAFIVGCGRSGTSFLGDILGANSEVFYLFEPYYLWSSINPKLDVLNLFYDIDALLFVDEDFFENSHKIRFEQFINYFNKGQRSKLLVEKTPLNIFRIGWLNQVSPCAKFIHIIRDGYDVCTSIERLATNNSYKIAGKKELNQWWGNKYSKWKSLRRDGMSNNYFPDEVSLLNSHISKAAYEWIVSLKEMDRLRNKLGDKLYEITYDELVSNPDIKLQEIAKFLKIEAQPDWLRQSITKIQHVSTPNDKVMFLPPNICKIFNHYQEKYNFPNRATVARQHPTL